MTGNLQKTIILMADDDHDDQYLVQEVWGELNLDKEIKFVSDGEELMKSLLESINNPNGSDGLPSLILLDLNMPRKNGINALQEIKRNSALSHIPVVVLTTSKNGEDVLSCYQLGAAGFITKPSTYKELLTTMESMCAYWFDVVTLPKRHSYEQK
jgi:CheY-like chemotaxis protein